MKFTVMAILMLQVEGKLTVQDPICQSIPDCPEYWQGITIHHLLTHTAGLADHIQWWDSIAGRPSTSLRVVERIKDKSPYFQPGEQFRYSNNGYIAHGGMMSSFTAMFLRFPTGG